MVKAQDNTYLISTGQKVWLWKQDDDTCRQIWTYEKFDRLIVSIIFEGQHMAKLFFNDCTQVSLKLCEDSEKENGDIG